MPEAIEPQLDELRRRARRRLVGAVVLALAAAVLVPMLLESDPKPLGEDVSVRIPPVDDGRFVNKLGEKTRASDTPAPAPPRTATVPLAEATPAREAAKEPVKAPAKDAAVQASPREATSGDSPKAAASQSNGPKPATEASSSEVAKGASAKPAGGAFSVQLAAFADDKGANALSNRLRKGGHPAYTEPYTTSRGTLWRVRVGPYSTRDAAEAARSKLKSDGQDGIIATAN